MQFLRFGRLHRKHFSEIKYGGSAPALKAAIAWRNEELAKTQVLSMVEFCQLQRSNNTSGVPGVHYLTTASQPNGTLAQSGAVRPLCALEQHQIGNQPSQNERQQLLNQ